VTLSAYSSLTLDETRAFVSIGFDGRIDEHTRDTLSAGWAEISEVCHCEGYL